MQRILPASIAVLILIGCGSSAPPPSDQTLLARFPTIKKDLEDLVKLMQTHTKFDRIRRSKMAEDLKSLGLSEADMSRCKAIFEKLDLRFIHRRSADPLDLHICVWECVFIGGGQWKGYACLAQPPTNTPPDLDGYFEDPTCHDPAYQRIEGNWYIYARQTD